MTARAGTAVGPTPVSAVGSRTPHRQLYARLLGLHHLRLRAWQRAVLAEGALVVALLLALADLASAWTIVVLPLAVAAVVKAHDVLAGLLAGRPTAPPP